MNVQELLDFLQKIEDKSVKCYAYKSCGEFDGPIMEELDTVEHRMTHGYGGTPKIGVYFNEG